MSDQLIKNTSDNIDFQTPVKFTAGVGQEYQGYTADHTITIAEYLTQTIPVVDTTSGDVTMTLPATSDIPNDGMLHKFDIAHTKGGNDLIIKCADTDTFVYGNTYFNLGTMNRMMTLGALNNGSSAFYGLQRNLTIKGSFHRDASWASSNFSSTTVIPWDSESYNNQSELLHYQEADTGSISSVADAGGGDITVTTSADHGLSVGDHVTISGTTDYNGDYTINTVPSTTTFTVTKTYTSSQTGTWTTYTRVWILADGDYELSYTIDIDSTGGSTWNATAQVYKNGVALGTTQTRSGNYGNEDQSMALPKVHETLSAGDYLDVRINQNNLTGNMVHHMFNVEIRL